MSLEDLLGYLPPHIEGSLIHLMNESPPDRGPVSREEWTALEWRRLITLQQLHSYFAHDVHAAAVETVRSGKPFGLYLRNFDLGGQVARETLIDVETGLPARVTRARLDDLRLTRKLHERFGSSLPFIGVANPAFDDWAASVERLYLRDDDWYESVQQLLEWASVIVVFVSDAESEGLRQELAAIQQAARAAAAVIVVPRDAQVTIEGTRQVRWDESAHALEELVHAVQKSCEAPRPTAPRGWAPQPKLPTDAVRQFFSHFAFAAMDEANELLERGDAVGGLDSLYRGFGVASFIRDVPARAAVVGTMARVYRRMLNERTSAEICYQLSEELWAGLAQAEPQNQSYANAFKTMQRERRELNEECVD